MPWQFMLTLCVLNVKSLILEGEKIVHKWWITIKMLKVTMKNNWFVQDAVTFRLITVPNMETILLSLNVNFVVLSPNGSVGEILIFVNRVIKDNVMVIMYQNMKDTNCQNVKVLENAQSAAIMDKMANRKCWDVQYVETTNKIQRISDL